MTFTIFLFLINNCNWSGMISVQNMARGLSDLTSSTVFQPGADTDEDINSFQILSDVSNLKYLISKVKSSKLNTLKQMEIHRKPFQLWSGYS